MTDFTMPPMRCRAAGSKHIASARKMPTAGRGD